MRTAVGIKEGALGVRRVVLSLMAMGLALLLANGVAYAAPANDDFANAQRITGAQATLTGTNVDATKENGEPNHANVVGGKSVWYHWTPQSSGTTTIDTIGSDFDTLLAVYTGNAVNGLTQVASNDDASSGGRQSKVQSVQVTAGTTYRIAVDGYKGFGDAASGSITLNLATYTPPPENDAFANAQRITGANATLTGTSAGATKEGGEPNHAGNVGGKSVWYTWQAPSNGEATIDTSGSNFNTLLAVYTGNAVGSLTEVASNDEDPRNLASTSRLESVQVTAGTTYRIAVDGYKGFGDAASGSITLNVAPDTSPPENDAFANAQQIAGGIDAANLSGTNFDATEEVGEPDHANNPGGRSVWYHWTPQQSGAVGIDTLGSDFDTLLAVYTGNAVGSLTEVVSNDDARSTQQSYVRFDASAGTTYRIAVDGYRDNSLSTARSGNIGLHFELISAPTANDDFASAQRITGAEATLTGTNVDSTEEVGEPDHANNPGGRSVWYHWTPQQSGAVGIDTLGSDFDTLLAVYTGNAVGSLTEVVSNDDARSTRQSRVNFQASAGTTYRIAVDGFNLNRAGAEIGSVTLNVASSIPDTTAPEAPVITSPANNSFDTDGNVTLSGTAEADATVELFEVATSGNASKGTAQADSTGAWSKTLDAVPDGSHTYTATATDAAGNASAGSEARTVKVDTAAPTVESWTPKGKKVRPTAQPTVTFDEAMDQGSVEATDANGLPTTFALYKKGSSVSLGATIAYDAAANKATLDPVKNLRRGVTYRAVVSVGAEDLAGNALAENKIWSFQVRR